MAENENLGMGHDVLMDDTSPRARMLPWRAWSLRFAIIIYGPDLLRARSGSNPSEIVRILARTGEAPVFHHLYFA